MTPTTFDQSSGDDSPRKILGNCANCGRPVALQGGSTPMCSDCGASPVVSTGKKYVGPPESRPYSLERRAAGILRRRYSGLGVNEVAARAVNACAAELDRLHEELAARRAEETAGDAMGCDRFDQF